MAEEEPQVRKARKRGVPAPAEGDDSAEDQPDALVSTSRPRSSRLEPSRSSSEGESEPHNTSAQRPPTRPALQDDTGSRSLRPALPENSDPRSSRPALPKDTRLPSSHHGPSSTFPALAEDIHYRGSAPSEYQPTKRRRVNHDVHSNSQAMVVNRQPSMPHSTRPPYPNVPQKPNRQPPPIPYSTRPDAPPKRKQADVDENEEDPGRSMPRVASKSQQPTYFHSGHPGPYLQAPPYQAPHPHFANYHSPHPYYANYNAYPHYSPPADYLNDEDYVDLK